MMIMSQPHHIRCWLHLMWATLEQKKILTGDIPLKISEYLCSYAKSIDIWMKKIYVSANHAHALVDLPYNYTIDELVKLLKGRSASWIRENRLLTMYFNWDDTYGAFSVSQSGIPGVEKYFENQEHYHKNRSYQEELAAFVRAYQLLEN